MKKSISLFLIFNLLFISTIRPAYSAVFVPYLVSGLSSAFKASSVIGKGRTLAWAGIESGAIASAVKGAGIFAGMSLVATGVIEAVTKPMTDPKLEVKIAGPIRVTSDFSNPDVPDLDEQKNYRFEVLTDPAKSKCFLDIIDNGNNAIIWSDDISAGTQFNSPLTFTGYASHLSSDYETKYYLTSFICNISETSYNPNFDNPTMQPDLINDVDYTTTPAMVNGMPVNAITPDEANQGIREEGGTEIDFDQAMWDLLTGKPVEYQGLSYPEALNHANTISGVDKGKLSDYDKLPLTGDLPEKIEGDSTTTTTNEDGTTSTAETATDYTGLISAFQTVINAQTGEIVSSHNANTDRLVGAAAITNNKIDDLKLAADNIDTKLTDTNSKLDQIKNSITLSAAQQNIVSQAPPAFDDNALAVAADNQNEVMQQSIQNRTSTVVFTGLNSELVEISGSSSRSLSFVAMGETYTIDLQPFFTLGSLISVFIYIGSSLIGYGIVARSFG